jgi:hypothetical protein
MIAAPVRTMQSTLYLQLSMPRSSDVQSFHQNNKTLSSAQTPANSPNDFTQPLTRHGTSRPASAQHSASDSHRRPLEAALRVTMLGTFANSPTISKHTRRRRTIALHAMESNSTQIGLQNRLHQQRLEEEHGAGQIADLKRHNQFHGTRRL